jgi:phage anti-repressor protein
MKTFIFCTSYFDTEELYQKRYQKWINYYNDHTFTDNKEIFIIDDASNLDYMIDDRVDVMQMDQIGNHRELGKLTMYTADERKASPGKSPANSEGWWRSFNASLEIARAYDYEKIVHIESDAYLVSQRVLSHIDELKTGWTAFWAPKYYFPESSLQVICKDQFENFEEFIRCGSRELSQSGLAEKITPFTHIEKRFVGDRYGETEKRQLKEVDYFCQTELDTIITPE